MSERKVLNKYYPPDFDPSKIPRMKLAKNRQYTVRLMAPFNMRCKTCGEYIYKGKKFNARKEDVENETYLGIRIYRFYIKCTRCLQEISFKTDPQNTDYEIEAGATRNFMALKLAEEQARREQDEAREEEANNPMKLLENRTQQSRNEIELLESLEELRDLNRRQQTVDYETMLKQYHTGETERERQEREEREDEELIKSMKFRGQSSGGKVVAEEIVEEIKDELTEEKPPPAKVAKSTFASTTATNSTKISNSVGIVKRKQPLVIIKPKSQALGGKPSEQDSNVASSSGNSTITTATPTSTVSSNAASNAGGLSLLANYTDSSDDNE